MKNKLITIIILITIFILFYFFVSSYKKYNIVLQVITPTQLIIDFNNNAIADNGETVCISDIDSISTEYKNIKSIKSKYNLSDTDLINLSYLSKEFSEKNILNKKVTFIKSPKVTSQCQYGKIKIEGTDYSDIIYNSGYGIKNNQIGNIEKFKKNLEFSKKLDLVILNHHSNKYHKLDCEYGNAAHDKVIIPRKQLPKDAKPCNFCHKINKKLAKNKSKNILYINNSDLKTVSGNIALYKFDFTKKLKPDSHCSTEVCKLIVKSIQESKESIDIAIYGYDDIPSITSALKNAKDKGIIIRFVYDEAPNPTNTFYKSNNIIKNIANESKSDRTSPEGSKIMHNKFLIIDNQKVITGSMNYSKSGLSGYDANDVIIINSKEIAKLYKNEFEQMLNGKFHNAKLKNNSQNKFKLGNNEIEIYFSPQDKSATRIIQLINNAKSYIYIPTFLITHKGITDSLIKAKMRNVDIKIIIDANSVNTRNTKHKIIRGNNIALKAENYAGKLHSKTIIIDDEYIVIGSMNFSNSGENKNDENMIVIKNTEIAKNYRKFFLYLWNKIPDKYLKYAPRAESFDSIGSCQDGVDNNFDGKTDSQDEGCKQHL